jgi:Mlc titration factor MtfA (ptsG expression regulator)
MLDWLRRQASRASTRRTRRPDVPDDLWHSTLAAYPFLAVINPAEQIRLRALSLAFLNGKEFHGAGGLAITDAMAVAVAAQACLPLLHLAPAADATTTLRWYDDFVGIVLHPDEVLAHREVTDDDGVVHEYPEILTGEAMEGGPVMLSWADVADAGRSAAQGYNVVIHEFVHKMDMRDGEADGCPPLPPGFLGATRRAQARQRWFARLKPEFEKFCDQVSAADRFGGLVDVPWLDPYAAESLSEFFAVAAEAYFVNPHRLSDHSPALHDLLDQFFRPQAGRL